MNYKILFPFLTLIGILASCKANFAGKELSYSTNQDTGFKMIFVNDSILKVNLIPEIDNPNKVIYKYSILEKETLEKMKKNQPTVNFKTKKLYGQFYQNIAIKLVSGQNIYLKETDTLNFLKMRIDGKMTKRIYFDNGNKIMEFEK
ncbi:hypothetical protein [Urechidicola croceus]|uniref:Beta-lactamase-inhibitor-like PepSY-like domain-containing protein n=1 Tax=Urechidicola croceus TaxID=1850246 RepID=A0A1D8P4A0_9FLAO|nr:hypothetical protein [Urechidicola croceus]AOW19366.1 hypothetical protein LPB138_01115 [Urechidicola croceus]